MNSIGCARRAPAVGGRERAEDLDEVGLLRRPQGVDGLGDRSRRSDEPLRELDLAHEVRQVFLVRELAAARGLLDEIV
jgi:hypothetical protein